MIETIDHSRRGLLGSAASVATCLAIPRAALASVPVAAASWGPLKQVDAGVLDVGYAEMGPADGPVVILLHGWPYDIHSFVDVAPLLAAFGYRVLVPYARGYGSTRFLSTETFRNGQQAALATDVVAFMDALGIGKAVLAGFDWGARTANVVAALWPERCKAMVATSGYLIVDRERNRRPIPPKLEHGLWYQYYFATERGRAGYDTYRREFTKLVWSNASPGWRFDDALFERAAAAFDNPDHVEIVIHNYRWRLGLAEVEARFDGIEGRLAKGPAITVPTITLDGEHDAVLPASDGSAFADKFAGKHEHRIVRGAGHNLPQEAPHEFAAAILEVDRWSVARDG